jgi:hypothetical protein
MKFGVSPVVATILVIILTLIAAVAIGGFVFGIFGSSSSSVQLLVTNAKCKNLSNSLDCGFNIEASGITSNQFGHTILTINGNNIQGNCTRPIIDDGPNKWLQVCIFQSVTTTSSVTGVILTTIGAEAFFVAEVY